MLFDAGGVGAELAEMEGNGGDLHSASGGVGCLGAIYKEGDLG